MVTQLDYFSYSQLKLWESSRKVFWERYALGKETYDSIYISKGRLFMEALEFGLYEDDDPMLPIVIQKLKDDGHVLNGIEVELNQDLFIGEDESIKLRSFIDSANDDLTEIVEYKTGKHPWDEELVKENTQLLFYSTVIFLKTGKIPKSKLVWIQTEMDDFGHLYYTGNIFPFETQFTTKDINEMVKRILKTLKDIKDWQYEEVDLEDHIVKEYLEIARKKDALEGRLQMLKNEIISRMKDNNYGTSSYGSFTLAEKTVWSYSDGIG